MSNELKARVLDLQDENEQLRKVLQETQELLLKVATNLGVTANEQNQISLESILAASEKFAVATSEE